MSSAIWWWSAAPAVVRMNWQSAVRWGLVVDRRAHPLQMNRRGGHRGRHTPRATGCWRHEGFREDNQATADIGVRRSDDDVAGYAPGSRDHTVGRADELTGLDGRDGAGWFDRGILKDGGPNARMFTCGSPAIPQLAYSLWIPETNFSRRCCARFGYELGSIYEILPFHGRQMIKIASLSAFFP
jgi:hypothetical protein